MAAARYWKPFGLARNAPVRAGELTIRHGGR
jgi:hypothetical protein